MKIIIASDIHGSFKYAKRLDELIEMKKPDKIILLGDLLYHGAKNAIPFEYDTMGVANILNKYTKDIIAVRGNCDSEVDDMVTNFSILADYDSIDIDGIKFYLSHGHLNLKYDYLFNNHYLLSGHTHVYNLDGKELNPGSVGIPKVNKEHTCLYYENRIFYLIDLDNFNILQTREIKEK